MDDYANPGPPRLPPELQNKIDQCLSDVYQQAFHMFRASDSSSASADISKKTGDSILLGVRDSIAVAQRADNVRLSLQNHLPVELWCNVWQHLAFWDLIFATHVCKDWRAAALNAPTLWQHVEFYSTRHSSWCTCTTCSTEYRRYDPKSHAPGWKGNPYRRDATNINQPDFDILVARSRDLPLYVTIYVVPCHEAGELDLLSEWIGREHAHRLTGLTIFTADPEAPARFLSDFSALPALKYLIVWGLPYREGERGREGRRIMPRGLKLPLLEELGLATRFLASPQQSLPSVRTLWIEPMDLEAELRRALDACAGTVELGLNLSFAWPSRAAPQDPAWWRERTASLRTIAASGVSASCESWLRAALSPALPTLYLSYSGLHDLSEGGAVLSDLDSDIHLSVTMIPSDSETDPGDFLAVHGKDGEQRVRQVGFHMDRTPSCEDLLLIVTPGLDGRWRNIVSLTASETLWPLVVSAIPVPDGGAAINSVCLIMDALGRQRTPHAVALPALRSLRLELGTQALSMTPEQIDDFVRGLQIPLPLDVLEIEGQLINGDATDTLENIAGTVSLV